MLSGILIVSVLGVRKTKAVHEEIFANVTFEKQSLRTPLHLSDGNGDSALEWNDRFKFDISLKNSDVNISLWNQDGSHFLGQYNFAPLMVKNAENGSIDSWTKLAKRKWRLNDKVDGDIHLLLQWDEKPQTVTIDDFLVLSVLGVGGFGKVFQVKKKDSERIYAMKIIKKQYVVNKREVTHTMTERAVLGKIKHPFIVSLKYSFQSPERLFLVLDFCNGGELFYHLQKSNRFTERRSKLYAAEIILALAFLHENGIIYRDLKPENILLDMEGHISITDFGLAKAGLGVGIEETTKTFCGSIAYMAPEVFESSVVPYGKSVDYWSYGMVVYEMLAGIPPFYDRDQKKMIAKIKSQPLAFPSSFPALTANLVSKLLTRDPNARLSNSVEVQNHPWFADLSFDDVYNRKVEPEFRPMVSSATDLKYFDPEFTKEEPLLSLIQTTLSETQDEKFFGGFTYNADLDEILSA